ncbi:MAG: alginate export family protein [Verrucomicrobiota bacterium]
MNKRTIQHIATLALGLAAVLAGAQSAQVQSSDGGFEKWIQDIKHPSYWLTWGGDIRVREEYLDSVTTMGNANAPRSLQNWVRFRGRVFATVAPFEPVSVNMRLTTEPRYYIAETTVGNRMFSNRRGMDWTEGVIDNLNLKVTNLFEGPVTLTLGRQDIMLGDGWLVMDGTPLDGSRTTFFDAARMTIDMPDDNLSLDLMYIDLGAMNNRVMPVINARSDRALTDQNERGLIAYATFKPKKELEVNAYFMYKHDQRVYEDRVYTPYTGYQTARGDNGDIYTLGGRVVHDATEHVRVSVEGAYQFGRKQETGTPMGARSNTLFGNNYHSISACGLNSRISYLVKDKMNNVVYLAYEYESGDDPSTSKDEQFDPMWGRWPRWSEMYIYSYPNETKVAFCSNVHRVGPGWTISPNKYLDFVVNYNLLYADQAVPTRASVASTSFSRHGHDRGQYLQAIMKAKFNKHLVGHLWAEVIWPGNFYSFKEQMTFLRWEVMASF